MRRYTYPYTSPTIIEFLTDGMVPFMCYAECPLWTTLGGFDGLVAAATHFASPPFM